MNSADTLGRRAAARSTSTRLSRASRYGRHVVGLIVLLAILIAFLPWLLSQTRVLNGLLKRSLAEHEIEATVGAARFGWFTAVRFHDIQMVDRRQRWSLQANGAWTELTLWQLIFADGELGEFHIQRPTFLVNADRPWPPRKPPSDRLDEPSSAKVERLKVTIEDGQVLVRSKSHREPEEFIRGANFTVDYEERGGNRTVIVHPGRPVQQVALTREMCDLGIKYVLPILADVTWVSGSLSLELEQCRIPLDDPSRAHVKGALTIHSVESGLRGGVAEQMGRVAQQFGKRFGVDELPQAVRLAHESTVPFQVRDRRVEHQNLAFGLPSVSPDLVVTTAGTVGMDKSLDLVATLPPIGKWLGDGPMATALSKRRLQLPIGGTLDEPRISLAGHDDLAEALIEQLSGSFGDEVTVNSDELREAMDEVGESVGEILERMRQRRQQRRSVNEPQERRPGLFQRMRERRRSSAPPPP